MTWAGQTSRATGATTCARPRGNLSKRQESVFRELKDAWTQWDATMLPCTAQNASWSNKQNSLPDRY
jgi:hypothetical protein